MNMPQPLAGFAAIQIPEECSKGFFSKLFTSKRTKVLMIFVALLLGISHASKEKEFTDDLKFLQSFENFGLTYMSNRKSLDLESEGIDYRVRNFAVALRKYICDNLIKLEPPILRGSSDDESDDVSNLRSSELTKMIAVS